MDGAAPDADLVRYTAGREAKIIYVKALPSITTLFHLKESLEFH